MITEVMKTIREEQASVRNQDFSDPVRITIQIRKGLAGKILDRLQKHRGIQAEEIFL
jgi:hypothetical protein